MEGELLNGQEFQSGSLFNNT